MEKAQSPQITQEHKINGKVSWGSFTSVPFFFHFLEQDHVPRALIQFPREIQSHSSAQGQPWPDSSNSGFYLPPPCCHTPEYKAHRAGSSTHSGFLSHVPWRSFYFISIPLVSCLHFCVRQIYLEPTAAASQRNPLRHISMRQPSETDLQDTTLLSPANFQQTYPGAKYIVQPGKPALVVCPFVPSDCGEGQPPLTVLEYGNTRQNALWAPVLPEFKFQVISQSWEEKDGKEGRK